MLIKWLCSLFVGIPVSHTHFYMHCQPLHVTVEQLLHLGSASAGICAEGLLPQCTVPGMERMDDQ